MKQSKLYLSALFTLLAYAGYSQQTGIVRGSIIDDGSGETLIGATAQIVGSTNGTVTDLDGNFSMSAIAPGKYTVQFSYIGYQIQKVEDVLVHPGQVTLLNIRLKSEATNLEEV